ncbi:MAG: hypothetical protein HC822_21600, partial [Oscillochloris sp.]|nr:hypothetical protein [Oscillochloris sp.]
LAWMAGFQASLVLAAALLGDGLALVGAHVMLWSLPLSTLVGVAAVSVLERSSGSDDYSSELPGPLLRTAGALWLIGGFAAIGLPPFFGFWGRRWLFEGLRDLAPWGLPALLAAGVLLMSVVLVPIGRFWTPLRPDRLMAVPRFGPQLIGGIAVALLVCLGTAPLIAWQLWLQALPLAPGAAPTTQIAALGYAVLGVLIGLGGLLLLRLPSARTIAPERDEQPVRLGPDGLSAELAPLALLGRAGSPLRLLWDALEWSSNTLRTVMLIFEQRYYLFGVLLVLVVLMLLMAQ